jgi:hypothetical protein
VACLLSLFLSNHQATEGYMSNKIETTIHNQKEHIDRITKDLLELKAAARVVVSCWESGDLAGAVRHLDSLIKKDEEAGLPWCEACQSWHHVHNSSCFKLTGRQARVRC